MEKEAEEILEHLETNGFSAYKVGGCVRDQLLGYAIQDIDIATSATPEQVMTLFPRVIPTGIKHGTVTVIGKCHSFEVTTFRLESSYSNHRQPDRVEFVVDIVQDLTRRDFTINAMALDRRGNLIDPYGGELDLQRRILRAVGNPYDRFEEDALRILRGVRFSSRFLLTIEPSTWIAMTRLGRLLTAISRERIRDELDKMIAGNHPGMACKRLSFPGFLPFQDVNELFSAEAVARLPLGIELLPPISRWVGLFLHVGWEQQQAEQFLRDWKFSNKFIQDNMKLFKIAKTTCQTPIVGKKLLLAYGLKHVLEGLQIKQWLTQNDKICNVEKWKTWDAEIPIRHPGQLAVNGQDLLNEFGGKPGPWIGQVIHTLFERVALYGISNVQEILFAEARKVLKTSEGTDTKPI